MSDLPLPPHNRDAERGVIGGILRDPAILPDVLTVLRPEGMYFDSHRKLFAAIQAITDRSEPVDLVMLHAELKTRRELDDVGGVMYLHELWEAVPTGANAMYHAKLVRDTALVRGLIHASNEILRDAYNPTGSAAELLAQAERKLFALNAEMGDVGEEPQPVAAIARDCLIELDGRIASGETLSGLSTGYAELDKYTGGLANGELIVLGARPSLGKTALSLNIADRVAESGSPVLFFSLEMPRNDITQRLLSMESGVPMHLMRRPRQLLDAHLTALHTAATGPIARRPLYVRDGSGKTAAWIGAVARRSCRRQKVCLIIVDYLQLIQAENSRDNRSNQVGMVALRMKNLAMSLNVPVILLSQLNRELELQKRRPMLSDLRESGEIEQHADRVLFLHREQNLPHDQPVWPMEVIFAKNRNGPVGSVPLDYRRPVLRFENARQAA